MLKIEKGLRNKNKKIFMWISALINFVAAALIIIAIFSDKFTSEQYGIALIWISAIINYSINEIIVFKYKPETKKLLESTISKTQVKAKSKSFDFTMLISLIACLICSLIFAINGAESSQFILGIYVAAIVLFFAMFATKTYFTSKFRKHITE